MALPVVIDFETEAIGPRPEMYPPKPVGVAIWEPGKKPVYLAWGHPDGNNSTKEKAASRLRGYWRGDRELLFHNAKFDLEVAEKWFELALPPWERTHDTLYQVFLKNPHARSLSLKPSAEHYLDMPPDEQKDLELWIRANVSDTKDWGAYISKAPAELVGRYAIGDVVRTRGLHEALYGTFDAGERRAYDRERRLMPILLRNEQEGMRLDLAQLEQDIPVYQAAMEKAEEWLQKRLKAPGLDLDKKEDVARVLDREGIITEWVLTPKSRKKSTSKKYMTVDKFNDPKVAQVLGYRNRLQTVLSMSMLPWQEQGKIISTTWNQVRQTHGEDAKKGTRTGRLSCSRFQNITKDFEAKDDGYTHPGFLRVPALPLVRRYVLPDKHGVFLHRDYSQQELRILAHFEDGPLLAAYSADPHLDVHVYVQRLIKETTGLALDRGPVKIMNFGKVYGMGIPGIIAKLRCSEQQARTFAAAHRRALPGLASLESSIKDLVRDGQPIRTWGGRLYYVEEAKEINGVLRNFDYKLVNYLIQGSAADCTKEALIRYDALKRDSRFMVTVHDEINISAPKKALKREMALLREAMESVEFDVPMLSDAKVGESWGTLKKWVE